MICAVATVMPGLIGIVIALVAREGIATFVVMVRSVVSRLTRWRADMVRDRRNRRIGDIQRDLRPDQGGEVLSEFMLEVVWPLATFVVLMTLVILVVYL